MDKFPIMSNPGLPEHEPTLLTRTKVEAFNCAGFSQTDIANYLDIDEKTLRKHYRVELDQAKMDKISTLSNNVYKLAMEGNEKMMEFVLKCQGRWSYARPPEDEDKERLKKSLLEKVIEKL